MKERLISGFTLGGLILIIIAMCVYISGIDDRKAENVTTTAAPTAQVIAPPVTTPITSPAVTTTLPAVVNEGTTAAVNVTAPVSTAPAADEKTMPESTKEIIDKYTQLVNAFKEKSLPTKRRNFRHFLRSSVISAQA